MSYSPSKFLHNFTELHESSVLDEQKCGSQSS